MNELRIHTAAQAEYEEAARWYAERSVRAAERFETEVDSAIKSIIEQPDRYARIDDRHRIFILHRFPYYVAYRHNRDLVEVIAIRHSSRDQDA